MKSAACFEIHIQDRAEQMLIDFHLAVSERRPSEPHILAGKETSQTIVEHQHGLEGVPYHIERDILGRQRKSRDAFLMPDPGRDRRCWPTPPLGQMLFEPVQGFGDRVQAPYTFITIIP
jgi:hypothetical protein